MPDFKGLTTEDRQYRYARFFERKLACLTPQQEEILRQPMDIEKALRPADMNLMLMDGYLEEENGYCLWPDKTGYISVLHQWPDVSLKMYDWWLRWYDGDDLRYALWYPGAHFASRIGWVVEDIGMGPMDIYFFEPVSCEVLGLDPQMYKESATKMLVGSCAFSKLQDEDSRLLPPLYLVVCHFVREWTTGIEIRSRFWAGYTQGTGGLIPKMYEGTEVTLPFLKELTKHCMLEFANLRNLLPQLYKEEAL